MSTTQTASSRSWSWRWVIGVVTLILGITIVAPLLWDAVLSGLLMVEVLRPLRPGPAMWVTRSPKETRVTFDGSQRMMEANLYTPAGGGRRAGARRERCATRLRARDRAGRRPCGRSGPARDRSASAARPSSCG